MTWNLHDLWLFIKPLTERLTEKVAKGHNYYTYEILTLVQTVEEKMEKIIWESNSAFVRQCGAERKSVAVVGTLHGISHQSQHLQRLAPLMWSLIKITLKPQEEEEAKTPDHSKINQKKPRINLTRLYAN